MSTRESIGADAEAKKKLEAVAFMGVLALNLEIEAQRIYSQLRSQGEHVEGSLFSVFEAPENHRIIIHPKDEHVLTIDDIFSMGITQRINPRFNQSGYEQRLVKKNDGRWAYIADNLKFDDEADEMWAYSTSDYTRALIDQYARVDLVTEEYLELHLRKF